RLGDHASFQQANSNPLNQAGSIDQLRDWVVQHSVSNWAGWFGKSGSNIGVDFGGGILTASGGGAGGGGVTTPTSNTNTQEAGVDEADILKTDGQYLYTIDGNELLVIDA